MNYKRFLRISFTNSLTQLPSQNYHPLQIPEVTQKRLFKIRPMFEVAIKHAIKR